jgi:hypothetical protein
MSSFEPASADAAPEPTAAEQEPDRAPDAAPTDLAAAEPEPATATAEAQPPSRVEAAVAELGRLPDLDLADHPDLYQRIHTELQGALSAIDDA